MTRPASCGPKPSSNHPPPRGASRRRTRRHVQHAPAAATVNPAPPQGTVPAPGAAAPAGPQTAKPHRHATMNWAGRSQCPIPRRANSSACRLQLRISAKAMKANKADIDQIKQLVSAAVGLDPQRGDQVAVIARNFTPAALDAPPFYETDWFAAVLRNVVALIAVLLVLLLGVRPLIKALKREPAEPPVADAEAETPEGEEKASSGITTDRPIDPAVLSRQVGRAQQIVAEQPDDAVAALRQMLGPVEAAASA